eukprot:gene22084-biopygen20710
MARAWRGHGAGVARAWRGRGTGVARAFPVPPGPLRDGGVGSWDPAFTHALLHSQHVASPKTGGSLKRKIAGSSAWGHRPCPRHARATHAKKWPIARATPAPVSCDPWGKRQRTRTGRGPDAGRTIEFEETDADRTRTG